MPKIKLEDLKPQFAPFTLSTFEGKTFHLKPFSLAAKTWATTKYGSIEKVNDLFKKSDLTALVDLFWYLLKEKEEFGNMTTFLESVLTVNDQVNLLNAVTLSLGVSQAQANELYKGMQEASSKKAQAQTKNKARK